MAPSDPGGRSAVWSATSTVSTVSTDRLDRLGDDDRGARQPARQPARRRPTRPSQPEPESGPERPREVRTALVLLVILAAVLSFVGVWAIVFADSAATQLRNVVVESGQSVPIDRDDFALLLRITGGVILLVGIGHAIAAHGVRQRRGWARIVGYVSAGIVAAFCLIAAVQGLTDVTSIVLLAAAVGAIAFLAQRPVSDYLSPDRRKESS